MDAKVKMDAKEYRALRAKVGTQPQVAKALGIDITTLQRREGGKHEVTREAEIAMRHLEGLVATCGRMVGKMGRPCTAKP
jgi:hypothetical protein